MFLAGVLVSGALAIYFLVLKLELLKERNTADSAWSTEAFWLGLAVVFAGMVPVVISNREANFYYFSRYMLASSAGAVIVVTAVIALLRHFL